MQPAGKSHKTASAHGKEFLDEVNRLVLNTPNQRGVGVFWWEPAVGGHLRNRSFFDNDDNALPVITVFDRFTGR